VSEDPHPHGTQTPNATTPHRDGWLQWHVVRCGVSTPPPHLSFSPAPRPSRSYHIVVVFILANFYLATVLEHFERTSALENGQVTFSDLVRFRDTWRHFDDDDQGFVTFAEVRPFLMRFAKCGKWAKVGGGEGRSGQSTPSRTGEASGSAGGEDVALVGQLQSLLNFYAGPAGGGGAEGGGARMSEQEKEIDRQLTRRFVLGRNTDDNGRTPFMAYIAKGLYSRRWWGLVRAEIRALSLQVFVQRYMVHHRHDYKYRVVTEALAASTTARSASPPVPSARPSSRSPLTPLPESLHEDLDASLTAREAAYVARLREDAHREAAAIPENDIPVPFGKLLVTLCKWKLGSNVLSPEERLHREMRLTRYYSEMMAARVQSVIRGFLHRRTFNLEAQRRAARLLSRWWRRRQASRLFGSHGGGGATTPAGADVEVAADAPATKSATFTRAAAGTSATPAEPPAAPASRLSIGMPVPTPRISIPHAGGTIAVGDPVSIVPAVPSSPAPARPESSRAFGGAGTQVVPALPLPAPAPAPAPAPPPVLSVAPAALLPGPAALGLGGIPRHPVQGDPASQPHSATGSGSRRDSAGGDGRGDGDTTARSSAGDGTIELGDDLAWRLQMAAQHHHDHTDDGGM